MFSKWLCSVDAHAALCFNTLVIQLILQSSWRTSSVSLFFVLKVTAHRNGDKERDIRTSAFYQLSDLLEKTRTSHRKNTHFKECLKATCTSPVGGLVNMKTFSERRKHADRGPVERRAAKVTEEAEKSDLRRTPSSARGRYGGREPARGPEAWTQVLR